MEDPYQFAESLDEKTLSYVKGMNAEFDSAYGRMSNKARGRITEYMETRRVLQASVSGTNVAALYRENQNYRVSLNNRDIYSTDKLISWISLSDDGNRVALFETAGSDMGVLKIIRNGKAVQEIVGNITQLIFTPGSFFIVKSYIEGPSPDGGEKNSHRVLMNGEIVFGSGLDSTQFIHLHKSKGKMIATVGDWNRSSIYCGDMEQPGTWKKIYDLDTPAEPVGIVDGKVSYLQKKGNGLLKIGEKTVVIFPSPVESCILVREGFLVTHLVDAKVGVSAYDFSGKKLREFPMNDPMGLTSSDSDEEKAVMVMSSFGVPYSLWMYDNLSLTMKEENRMLDLKIEERYVQSNGARIHYFLVEPEKRGKKRGFNS